jgi:hypothetical protein
VIPGVIPDRTQASIDAAMAQAHEELPPLANSQVQLALFDPAAGLKLLGETVYQNTPGALDMICTKLAEIGGAEPTIVVATRMPHNRHHPHTDHQETTT